MQNRGRRCLAVQGGGVRDFRKPRGWGRLASARRGGKPRNTVLHGRKICVSCCRSVRIIRTSVPDDVSSVRGRMSLARPSSPPRRPSGSGGRRLGPSATLQVYLRRASGCRSLPPNTASASSITNMCATLARFRLGLPWDPAGGRCHRGRGRTTAKGNMRLPASETPVRGPSAVNYSGWDSGRRPNKPTLASHTPLLHT